MKAKLLGLLVLGVLAVGVRSASAQAYDVTILSPLPGTIQPVPTSINDSGQVVGYTTLNNPLSNRAVI